ncbi:MAG: PLP-dependent aminotransferase family protein [Pseudomonadota bacterium]
MLQLSQRIPHLQASPIREILAVIERPGMISFAGGLPSPDSFPQLRTDNIPERMLQYGASEGEPELRAQICRDMQSIGLDCTPGQVLILSGSQQGIDLCAKLFVDHNTPIALENPTYLAALQVFRFFGARFVELDPMLPEVALSQKPPIPFCYVIPTFQNPTGRCYTSTMREHLAEACMQRGTVLFEDDPYRDLVYEPCERRPICSYLRSGNWIYQGSFSKSFAPGLRLGFLVCSEALVPYLTRLKQAADLHSNRLSQYLVLQQLQDPQREQRMEQLRMNYLQKRDYFAASLQQTLAPYAEWEVPAGGLFFWLKLKTNTDTQALLARAIDHGVAFMPGEPFFYSRHDEHSYIRLNFSHANETAISAGLTTLGELLSQTSTRT